MLYFMIVDEKQIQNYSVKCSKNDKQKIDTY